MHRANPRSAFRLRSWNSSKITQPMPPSPESLLQHARQNALRDPLRMRVSRLTPRLETRAKPDAAADGSHRAGCAPYGRRRRGAAMRRGSSIRIFCPSSQGLASKKSGTMVLLPAPGGASNSNTAATFQGLGQCRQGLIDRQIGVAVAGPHKHLKDNPRPVCVSAGPLPRG